MKDKLKKIILKLMDEEQLLLSTIITPTISGTEPAEIYGV